MRDIIAKSVITQFKAHKSPISALCFDPSGTLLVTASVQGHNINVFRIMPGVAGSSSGSDTCASYAHLYRLQRGFTNAVRAIYLFNPFLFTGSLLAWSTTMTLLIFGYISGHTGHQFQ